MTPLRITRSRAELPAGSMSQSSAMMPLTWHLAILVFGTVALAAIGAPAWLQGLLGGLAAITAVLSWVTYFRLLNTDRDALRRTGTTVPRAATEHAFVTRDAGEVALEPPDAGPQRLPPA